MTDTGPLVRLHFSFSGLPWRIAPGWSVVAAAIAGGMSFTDASALLRLLVAVVLADVLWGLLRQYTAQAEQRATLRVPAILPYATESAPLARLLHTLALPGDGQPAGWHGALGGLLLTVGVSVLLGWRALAVSLTALLFIWLAGRLRRRGDTPFLVNAVLDVGLPWLLALSVLGISVRQWPPDLLAIGAVWIVLQWGMLRLAGRAEHRLACGAGLLLLAIALIVLRRPWDLVLAAGLLAPAVFNMVSPAAGVRRYGLAAPWLLATMIVLAVLIRV